MEPFICQIEKIVAIVWGLLHRKLLLLDELSILASSTTFEGLSNVCYNTTLLTFIIAGINTYMHLHHAHKGDFKI